jgi:hypothetical protein
LSKGYVEWEEEEEEEEKFENMLRIPKIIIYY